MRKLIVVSVACALVAAFCPTVFGAGEYNPTVVVEPGGPAGQNFDTAGDGFDQTYDLIGAPVAETPAGFGSFGGGIDVNWDAGGLYIGISGGSVGGNNYMVFVDVMPGGVPALTATGDSTAGSLNAPDFDHLDQSENLAFGLQSDGATPFEPDVAILAGDEFGDANFASFGRLGIGMFTPPGGNDTGQGVVDLTAPTTLGGPYVIVPGSDLEQFDAPVQTADDLDGNQDAEYVEVIIPSAYLAGLGYALVPGNTLEVAAIVAGGDAGNPTPTTFFSTTYVGTGAPPPGGGGPNVLNSSRVTLGAIPEPSTLGLLGISALALVALRRRR